MSRPPRILIHVQHLLGVGHLKRALLIARALGEAGLTVRLVSGGLPIELADAHEIDLFQLPAMRASDASFSDLADSDGNLVDEAFRMARRDCLLAQFRDFAPDALIIEAFPFARRQLRFELIPLLEAADAVKPRPRILCSIRDILQEKRDPDRLDEQVATLRRFFDRVFVHGDPGLVRLQESFPRWDQIADLIEYTGYVAAPPAAHDRLVGAEEVVVSAGGGAVGARLLETAVLAQPLSEPKGAVWRLLVGENVPGEVLSRLRAGASERLVVERTRSDFPALLANCAVSVSQCGYNTVMDLLTAGAPAVVVPFRGDGETEQPLRAEKLGSRGLVQVVDESELNPARLAAAVRSARLAGRPPPHAVDLDGAARTARLVARCLGSCGA